MTITAYASKTQAAGADVRPALLRGELEQTRLDFHALLKRVEGTRWRDKSPSSAWTMAEVCTHLTWALEMLPQEVDAARQSKGMFNLPDSIGNALSYWYTRWLARAATPPTLTARYDRAMDATLRLLDTIPPEDWARGANFYGEGFHSVEDLFHAPAKHLAEHMAGL